MCSILAIPSITLRVNMSTGKAAEVVFPSTASSQTTFKPRISCTHATLNSNCELIQLHQRLHSHTFESNKVLRKRKRTEIDQLAEDTGSYVQELLEALASVGPTILARQGDVNLLTISIDGMLHPYLAQGLLEFFS